MPARDEPRAAHGDPGTERGAQMHGGATPFDAKRAALAASRRYNTTAGQRARILGRLHLGPATRPELERDCWVPSVTKRVAELRREGWPIFSSWTTDTAPDGSVSGAVRYTLGPGTADPAQLALPLET